MLNIKNASGFRRGVAGLSLILGPILILLGSLTQTGSEAEGAAYLDALADSPGATQLSTLLSYFGFALLVPGIVGAVHVVRQRGVVLAHVAGAIALLGAVGIAALVLQFELGGVKAGTIVGSLGLMVAVGYVGVKLLTMSDAVWERGGAPGRGSPRVA